MAIGSWIAAPDAGEGASWGDLFTGAPAAVAEGPKPTWDYTSASLPADTPSSSAFRWSGDLPDFTGAPDWLQGSNIGQQIALNSLDKYSNYRGDRQAYSGNPTDLQNTYYAGDSIGFPAFESNLFTNNLNVPQQYRGDRWYGLLDTSRPGWQSNPAGATRYEFRDLGTDALDQFAPLALSAIMAMAGMPSPMGIAGQALGELGFSGMSSLFGSGGGGFFSGLSSLFGGDSGGGFLSNLFGGGEDALSSLVSSYGNSDAFMGDLSGGGGDFWGNDYGLYSGSTDSASFYPSSSVTTSSGGPVSDFWNSTEPGWFSPSQVSASVPSFSGGGGSDWGGMLRGALPALSSIGSSIYGMSQADKLRKAAMLAASKSDPWGASGGRALADAQLQELMRNPGQVSSRDPSYGLRMQGAQRATGMYGQDSGAMAVAGANASTDWLNQRMAALGGLSGAGVNPGQAQQLALQGQMGANDLASRSLASLGYGLTRAFVPDSQNFMSQMLNRLFMQGVS